MLRDNPNRPHRDTVNYIRGTIKAGIVVKSTEEVIEDLKEIDIANEAHIRAKTQFSTINSDNTMINLIGTWARLQRVIWKMDDKYGSRE